MSVLTSYCHKDSKDIEKSIRVGVVGLPNVGRKSLINTLKKSRGIETTTGKARVHIICVLHLTTIRIRTSRDVYGSNYFAILQKFNKRGSQIVITDAIIFKFISEEPWRIIIT